jgi:hypothetical protein
MKSSASTTGKPGIFDPDFTKNCSLIEVAFCYEAGVRNPLPERRNQNL